MTAFERQLEEHRRRKAQEGNSGAADVGLPATPGDAPDILGPLVPGLNRRQMIDQAAATHARNAAPVDPELQARKLREIAAAISGEHPVEAEARHQEQEFERRKNIFISVIERQYPDASDALKQQKLENMIALDKQIAAKAKHVVQPAMGPAAPLDIAEAPAVPVLNDVITPGEMPVAREGAWSRLGKWFSSLVGGLRKNAEGLGNGWGGFKNFRDNLRDAEFISLQNPLNSLRMPEFGGLRETLGNIRANAASRFSGLRKRFDAWSLGVSDTARGGAIHLRDTLNKPVTHAMIQNPKTLQAGIVGTFTAAAVVTLAMTGNLGNEPRGQSAAAPASVTVPQKIVTPPANVEIEKPSAQAEVEKPAQAAAAPIIIELPSVTGLAAKYADHATNDSAKIIVDAALKGQQWATRSMTDGMLNGLHGFKRNISAGVEMTKSLAAESAKKTTLNIHDRSNLANMAYIMSVKKFTDYGAEYNLDAAETLKQQAGRTWHVPAPTAEAAAAQSFNTAAASPSTERASCEMTENSAGVLQSQSCSVDFDYAPKSDLILSLRTKFNDGSMKDIDILVRGNGNRTIGQAIQGDLPQIRAGIAQSLGRTHPPAANRQFADAPVMAHQ